MSREMPRKIVVAIEGSQPSNNAADYAVELASLTKAKVVFIHVVLLPQYVPADMRRRVSDELSARGRALLDGAKGLAIKKDVVSDGTVLETTASIANTICDYAEKEEADLIILGTRTGTSAVTKLMLGSVASGVANNAHCPVLVIR